MSNATTLSDVEDNIGDLRSKIKQDLDAEDPRTRLTALAAGLIDETYARPGDPYSNRDSKGILTLQCRHISFDDNEATLAYTGKSGVDQQREVQDSDIVDTLKWACEGEGPQTEIFQYRGSGGTKSSVNTNHLNDYIRDFGFTAKDIRTYHANELMHRVLEEKRSNGPNLNEVDDKQATLEEEFSEALEDVSEELGHKKQTLKNDYLLDGAHDQWVSEGSLDKKYAVTKVASRYLLHR